MPKLKSEKCDVCAGPNALSFSLIKHVKRDGRWTTRAAGTMYLCEGCWQAKPNARRRERTGRTGRA